MTFDELMDAGRIALRDDDPREAYRQFGRAHGVGHAVRRQHFAAHRGMIRASRKARRYGRCAQNVVELAAGFTFDWPKPPARVR